MPHPLASLIIPCYRLGHLLSGAIRSALDQSHPAVQVIVVNDLPRLAVALAVRAVNFTMRRG